MKIQTICLVLFLALFAGCNSSSEAGEGISSSSANTMTSPQPIVEDEALRPPKVPTI